MANRFVYYKLKRHRGGTGTDFFIYFNIKVCAQAVQKFV
jgi:hypothetical protein